MEVKKQKEGSKEIITITGEVDEFLRIGKKLICSRILPELLEGKENQIGIMQRYIFEQLIQSLLKDMGIFPQTKGFQYITEAVLICFGEKEIAPTTKVIYPVIAKKHRVTDLMVEKNIRDAIGRGYHFNRAGMESLFGKQLKKRPTNKEFISVLVNQFY